MDEERNNPAELKVLIQSVISELKGDQPSSGGEASVHWTIKVFGSAVLVLSVSLLIGLFQNLYSNVYDINQRIGKLVGHDEFNLTKTSIWNSVKDIQNKEVMGVANQERLKLSEERLKRVEDDNAKLREQVTGLSARIEVLEKARK